MYIAYSALRIKQKQVNTPILSKELTLRCEGYQTACNKYRTEITEIQKYIPGWLPPFELKA